MTVFIAVVCSCKLYAYIVRSFQTSDSVNSVIFLYHKSCKTKATPVCYSQYRFILHGFTRNYLKFIKMKNSNYITKIAAVGILALGIGFFGIERV